MSFEMIKSEVKAKEEESCEYIDNKEEYIGASNPPNDVMDSGVTGELWFLYLPYKNLIH